jgi:hypothetical protein
VDANVPDHVEKQYNIVSKLPIFESERDKFISTLSLLAVKVETRITFASSTTSMHCFATLYPSSQNQKGQTVRAIDIKPTAVALDGLKLVASWTSTVRELVSVR